MIESGKELDGGFRIIEARQAAEISAFRDLVLKYAGSLDFDLDFQDFEEEIDNLSSCYAPPRGCLLLAKRRTLPAGCVALRDLDGICCEMKRLYVDEYFRGQGVGRALAQAIIASARDMNYIKMRLDTVPAMVEARGLYESLGFRKIQPYRFNPIEGARYMELDLTQETKGEHRYARKP